MPFTWKLATARALKHQYQRAIDEARTNITYQVKYPNETRENPDHKVLHHCHAEAKKRLLENHEKILMSSTVPSVERPKRVNRVG